MMPATYNLEYYRGDTLTFYLNVKNADGAAIDLTGAVLAFTAATARGSNPPIPEEGYPATVVCSATLEVGQPHLIKCSILPETGNNFKAGVSYVYDVQVTLGGNVNTYITGNINVTEGVS